MPTAKRLTDYKRGAVDTPARMDGRNRRNRRLRQSDVTDITPEMLLQAIKDIRP